MTYDRDHGIDDERFRDVSNLVESSNNRIGLTYHRDVVMGILLCDSDGVAMGLICCEPELWFFAFYVRSSATLYRSEIDKTESRQGPNHTHPSSWAAAHVSVP